MSALDHIEQRMDRIERLLVIQAKETLTVEEAAMFMGVSVDHIYRLTSGANPKIGFWKPNGKNKYIEKDELMAYIRTNRTHGDLEITQKAEEYEKRRKRA